jgi:endoglucanase
VKSSVLLLLALLSIGCHTNPDIPQPSTDRMDFWQTQRKGANGNLTQVRPEWFSAAQKTGLEFIRFNVSWFVADASDFLIGDVDRFRTINQTDLAVLMRALDEAYAHNQRIILSMFELPGCRDGNATGEPDDRLWQHERFQLQSFEFWKQLAAAVKDHPAIVAYDPLNEPHPERAYGHEEPNQAFIEWLDDIEGTSADLNRFNQGMVDAIREVDPDTPIIVEGYFYASPTGLPYTRAIDDPAILYSFHNPAPWQFATFSANGGRYRYPDNMPEYWNDPGTPWTIDDLAELLEPVRQFIEENNIPAYQIIASELLCDRRVAGSAEYLEDMISLYNEQQWHWAFYAFREDMSWSGLDYEMGDDPIDAAYWVAVENGADYELLKAGMRHDNPIWDVLLREFR